MHGQVPEAVAQIMKDVLKEGSVFVIKKFLCKQSKTTYRPVESPFLVLFTRFTIVEERPGTEANYPFCTYSLTPFDEIPSPSGPPARFFGKLCSISAY